MLTKVKAVVVKVANWAAHEEPTLVIGAFGAVAAAYAGYRSGHLTYALIAAAIAAVQAVFTRSKVSPKAGA